MFYLLLSPLKPHSKLVTFQMGTHPALTASPIAYPIVKAAEDALSKLKNSVRI